MYIGSMLLGFFTIKRRLIDETSYLPNPRRSWYSKIDISAPTVDSDLDSGADIDVVDVEDEVAVN